MTNADDVALPDGIRRRIWGWSAGIIGTIIAAGFLGFVAWLTSMHGQVVSQGQRLAVLEAQFSNQERRLEKIEQKIDRMLELLQLQRRPPVGE